MTQPTLGGSPFSDLSTFTYGTTRLGDESIPFPERVKMARAAMETGVWFHTSHTYGDTFRVLRAAYDEDRAHVRPAIFTPLLSNRVHFLHYDDPTHRYANPYLCG